MAELGNYGQHQYFASRIGENQLVTGIGQTEFPSLHLMNSSAYHPRPQFHGFPTAANYSHNRSSSISPSTSPTQSTDSMSSSSTEGALQYHPADYERAAMEYPSYFYNGFYPHLPATMRHSYDLYPTSVAQAMALNNRLQLQEGLKGGKRPQRPCLCPNCKEIAAGLRPPLTDKENKTQKIHNCHYAGCDRTYGKTSHLKAHIRWHKGERPFFCKFFPCGKCFTRSDELTRHEKIHTKEKNYACDLCEKRFSRSDHLSKHRKIHTKVKGNKNNGTDGLPKKAVVEKEVEKSITPPILNQAQVPTYIGTNYLNTNVSNLSQRSSSQVSSNGSYTYPQLGGSTEEQRQVNYRPGNHEQFIQNQNPANTARQSSPVQSPKVDQSVTSKLRASNSVTSPLTPTAVAVSSSATSMGQTLNQINYSEPQIHLPTSANSSHQYPLSYMAHTAGRSSYNTDSILAVNPFSSSATETYIPATAGNWIGQNSTYLAENSSAMYYNSMPSASTTSFPYSGNNNLGY